MRPEPLHVVAIEDDARYRSGLEALLAYSAEFDLIHSFASPIEALEQAEITRRRQRGPAWDLVLMDLDLPHLSGVECTRRLKALLPDSRIIALTVFEDRNTILQAICAGADGYLLKHTPADRILAQLRAVIAGGSPLSAAVARTVLEIVRLVPAPETNRQRTPARGGSFELTNRERDVLASLVNGRSYKACARDLGISVDTVRSHIRSVYAKLQVHSVAEAVSRALREGLV